LKLLNNSVTPDKPVKQIFIWIEKNGVRTKAKILEVKQDSLGRLYISVF